MIQTLGVILPWALLVLVVAVEFFRFARVATRPANHYSSLMRGLPPATSPATARMAQLRLNAWRELKRQALWYGISAAVIATGIGVGVALETHPPILLGIAAILTWYAVLLAAFEIYGVLGVYANYLSARRRILLDVRAQDAEERSDLDVRTAPP